MKNAQAVLNEDLEYIYSNLRKEFSTLAGKNLLVTGGAGFLGYYLVQAVLYWNIKNSDSKPIQLTVYDNFMRGIPKWLSELDGGNNLSLVKHDMTNPLPHNIADFQYIIHAASIASPTYYRKSPIETMDANVNGLRSLLEYCLKQYKNNKTVEGFLFFSSSEIYGNPSPENIPTPESYLGNVSCTGPRACYDESKRYGETLCVNFARQYNLPIKSARPFNNYGPGMKITDRRVISDYARDIIAGRDIVMFSDGSPTRTFCYVADAIVGYYKILVKGNKGEAYNIGVEEPEVSIAEFANRMVDLGKALCDYKGKVVHKTSLDSEYLIDNPSRRCPVITKARRELGYNPDVSLDEGLKRSLIWYFDNRDAKES
ncbi:MAG: NAD-dependent epimerase/dehydratase family protein [Thermodesulfobacteriota bacterium]